MRTSVLAILALAATSVASAHSPSTPNALPNAMTAKSPLMHLQSFSIIVRNYDEAKTWYTEKLGFIAARDQKFGPTERFILMTPPGQREFGIVLQIAQSTPTAAEPAMNTNYSDRIGKAVNIVLTTDDVTAFANGLESRGVKLDAPPKQFPWGGQVTFKDLYGNSFVVTGPLVGKKNSN